MIHAAKVEGDSNNLWCGWEGWEDSQQQTRFWFQLVDGLKDSKQQTGLWFQLVRRINRDWSSVTNIASY